MKNRLEISTIVMYNAIEAFHSEQQETRLWLRIGHYFNSPLTPYGGACVYSALSCRTGSTFWATPMTRAERMAKNQKFRKCHKCQKMFWLQGPENRRCDPCEKEVVRARRED